MARLDELERLNRDLLRENQELKRENQELRAKVIALEAQLRRVVRRAFAPSSEVLIPEPGQQRIPELADAIAHLRQEAERAGVVVLPPTLTPDAQVDATSMPGVLSRRAPAARGRGRLTLPEHLAVVEERIELTPAEHRDTDGSQLVPVGTERSSRLDWEPGRFVHHVTLRTRYGRRESREPVLTAPVPPAIVPRGLGGDRLVLHIAHQKYALGVPLYRQRSDWLHQGVDLSTQTACSWMGHLARRLDGLTGAIRQQILAWPILHLDDTPVKQLEHGRRQGSCRIARIWCYKVTYPCRRRTAFSSTIRCVRPSSRGSGSVLLR